MKRIVPTFEQYISEDPDSVYATRPHLTYTDEGIPFGYMDGGMKIGNFNDTHFNLGKTRADLDTPGRIWPEKKIISFWRLQKPLDKVIKDINKVLKDRKIKVDSSWNIDVCSYSLLKSSSSVTTQYASILKPLNVVLKEIKNGDETDEYTVSWDYAEEMFRLMRNS